MKAKSRMTKTQILKNLLSLAIIFTVAAIFAIGIYTLNQNITGTIEKDSIIVEATLADAQIRFNCIEASLGEETSVYIKTYGAFLDYATQSEANPIFYQQQSFDLVGKLTLKLWFIREGVVYIYRYP